MKPHFAEELENSCLCGYQQNVTLTVADAPLISKSRFVAIVGVKTREMFADLRAQLSSKRTKYNFNVEFRERHLHKERNRPLHVLSMVPAIRKCSFIAL